MYNPYSFYISTIFCRKLQENRRSFRRFSNISILFFDLIKSESFLTQIILPLSQQLLFLLLLFLPLPEPQELLL